MVKKVDYTVLSRLDDLEVRSYYPMVIISVFGLSDNDSFRLLFDYIQGGNRSRSRIRMTSPVISSEKIPMTAPVISGGGSFSFVLPRDYDMDNAPEPEDDRLVLEEIPSRTIAALRFSGRATSTAVKEMTEHLLQRLRDEGIPAIGAPFLMRYNSPFMPGPFRRNEVAVKIRWSG
ncbi:MAG: SOUL family heme-binding protein [Thermoplasmatota archaeon]